jgi:YbgC/YbaW family acyl-CoA thioester hydrolase
VQNIEIYVTMNELDASGFMHHPAYFLLCERSREILYQKHGFSSASLKTQDIALVVASINANFYQPISVGPLILKLAVVGIAKKSFVLTHEIYGPSDLENMKFKSEITFVSVNYSTGRSCLLPFEVQKMLENFNGKTEKGQ